MEKLAVRGYVEVLKHYWEIVGIRRRLRDHFLRHPPALFIGVDAPDFNLDLEIDLQQGGDPDRAVRRARGLGVAARAHLPGEAGAVSLMLTVFPFEARSTGRLACR